MSDALRRIACVTGRRVSFLARAVGGLGVVGEEGGGDVGCGDGVGRWEVPGTGPDGEVDTALGDGAERAMSIG